MTHPSVVTAREFVTGVELPEPSRVVRPRDVVRAPASAFDTAKDQATLVGSDVISFVKGVTPEQRIDINDVPPSAVTGPTGPA